MAVQSKTTMVNGLVVHYLTDGAADAPPILLLQGTLGDAAFHWTQLIPELATDYRIYAPDLPGFGKSDPLPKTHYAALINWLQGFLSALELDEVTLVGHSFGGLLARLFTAQSPDPVRALILINGGVLPSKPTGLAKFLANTPVISGIAMGIFSRSGVKNRDALDWVVTDPHDTDRLTDNMVAAAAASAPPLATIMKMQILYPIPEQRVPAVPTLLLWGSLDTISPVKAGQRVAAAINGAKFREVDGCKHAPHIEQPDVIAFQINAFLERLSRPTKPDLPGAGKLGG